MYLIAIGFLIYFPTNIPVEKVNIVTNIKITAEYSIVCFRLSKVCAVKMLKKQTINKYNVYTMNSSPFQENQENKVRTS